MIGVLVMVLLSIVSRLMHFYVPGTDAYAGYAMAGAGFLALAHTLKHNEHIRVTLIIGKLQGGARRAMELWALSAAVLLSGLFAFYSARLAWRAGDVEREGAGEAETFGGDGLPALQDHAGGEGQVEEDMGQQDAVPPTKAFDKADPTTFAHHTVVPAFDAEGKGMEADVYFIRTASPSVASPDTRYEMRMFVDGIERVASPAATVTFGAVGACTASGVRPQALITSTARAARG